MLPRLIVIDDLFGRLTRERRNVCKAYDLLDVTGDDSEPYQPTNSIAEAVFCSSQIVSEQMVENHVTVALEAIKAGWPSADGRRWALTLLDLRFVSGRIRNDGEAESRFGDERFGLRILQELKREYPDLPVVILSSIERADVIEDCRKLGAADFIQRHSVSGGPSPREILSSKIREYGLVEDNDGFLAGRSLSLLKTLSSARRAATGGGNILLLGESGTGKELLAHYIHKNSPKASGPYKVFYAFGVAETLQEDLLFGHVKGAFTDAKTDRAGLFEQTSGGTLFIDEVGDIPLSLQNKLLRPIETRRVIRQGSDKEITVDFQLVLATNKALDEYAATGRLKFDLLNRVRAYPIILPPLRERTEDIPLLAEHLLKGLCRDHGARWPRTFHPDAFEKLRLHDWRDGNIRELRNVLERVVKDNKDAEIVVAGDIRFDIPIVSSEGIPSEPAVKRDMPVSPEDWINMIRRFSNHPDYKLLHGSWPHLNREISRLLARYLASAIEVTRRRRADGPLEGEVNLAGAVSCLMGRQVPTVKAADFVKRLLQFDEEDKERLFDEYPVLKEAFQQALRFRPKRPGKIDISSKANS